MEDLQIAYDLIVIMIGSAALSIAISWALRTGEADLRNFCMAYALFTSVLILTVLKKYLFLNVEGYSAWSWYVISGILQVFDWAVIVAMIYFFLGVYHVKASRPLTFAFLLLMFVSLGLVLSPWGAVLDARQKSIHLGIGFQISSVGYFASFTYAIVLGYALLHRVWKTDKRALVIGLLIFATVGYAETLASFFHQVRSPVSTLATENDFIYSSIPYVLYGIFVIVYFLNYFVPASVEIDGVFEAFLAKYGITEREREIILKVVQGKSNSDIARELFVSIATVKTHLHNIYTKIGVNSRYNLLARVRSGQ
jgi:DNA-binding CsgD family transcriptional regulator